MDANFQTCGTRQLSRRQAAGLEEERLAALRALAFRALLNPGDLTLREIEQVAWGYLVATDEVSLPDLQPQ